MQNTRQQPFSKELVEDAISKYSTPFYLYHEANIRRSARDLNAHFAWVAGGYKNYYAVKALPNPHILKILLEEGMGLDCSSLAELLLAERLGVRGEDIMFTSNDTPAAEYQKALDLGAIINLDDISHIDYVHEHCGLPDLLSFRYNPGPLRAGNAIIGKPEEAKYGLTREQLFKAYEAARSRGVQRFALHTMVASNELDPEYFIETGKMLFDLVIELREKLGIRIEFINLGGGIGIPYRPEEEAVDLGRLASGIQRHYKKTIQERGSGDLNIVTENGRYVTGPHGYLVTRVIHRKETYKHYVGTDACMANLMRPGMYGAYHHISILGKEETEGQELKKYDVTGSLCENNDKFAIDRMLPTVDIGDILLIHDGGAHGHSMGFNYNGKLRCAEVLYTRDSQLKLIRRAESYEDLFATLDFTGIEK